MQRSMPFRTARPVRNRPFLQSTEVPERSSAVACQQRGRSASVGWISEIVEWWPNASSPSAAEDNPPMQRCGGSLNLHHNTQPGRIASVLFETVKSFIIE